MSRKNGYIIYEGPSMLDGSPIVVIATGFADESLNEKTGNMIQTWILRADMSPIEAAQSKADKAICGSCPHRGESYETRSCYVKIWQAPSAVYGAYKRGSYPKMDLADLGWLFAGRPLRLGSYGDMTATPLWLVDTIASAASYVTGYTHQWRNVDHGYSKWLMASADSAADRFTARAFGYRTFRVRSASESVGNKEIVCPASKEAGQRSNCAKCKMCGGRSGNAKKDIVIMAHGAYVGNYYRRDDIAEKIAA